MSILLMLVPISLLLLGLAVAAFVWAVRRGQFDDLDTPALDILEDDDRPAPAPGLAGGTPGDSPAHTRAGRTVQAAVDRREGDA